jgi:predicted nucleotidyltransferase
MNRDQAIGILRANAADIRAAGVIALYLYGSAAADRMQDDSDIDLFADVDYARFGFIPYMRLRERLATLLGRPVDFTTRAALHPDLRLSIEKTAVKIFDATFDSVAAE